MLLLEAAVMGSFLSLDLIVFFFFFELTLVPAYFIIAGWGHERRAYAAVKFFLYTFLGSAFLLVGILSLAFIHQSQTGVLTFSLPALEHTRLSSSTEILLFLAFTSAFAVKAPLFPFHTWSPDAYTEAPAGGSVVLSGVLAKLGTYGIIRFDLNLFPQATRTLAPLILTLAVIGIVYGAVVACAQRDMKRLVTYSSLAQIGFIALGTFALSTQGLSGAVLLMLNHGLIVGGLFLLIGFIYERRGTWQTTELRGLQKVAPVMAGVFTVLMMASIGVPGLNGFVSEFLVLVGTFLTHRWWAVVAVVGVIVAAIYLLWAYQQVFHGVPKPEDEKTRDLSWLERLVVAPADRPHRGPGRLSQAGAGSHRPVGEPTGRPRREGHRPLPAAGGHQGNARAGGPAVIAALHAGATTIAIPPIRYLSILPIIIMGGGAVVLLALASLVSRPLRVRVEHHRERRDLRQRARASPSGSGATCGRTGRTPTSRTPSSWTASAC